MPSFRESSIGLSINILFWNRSWIHFSVRQHPSNGNLFLRKFISNSRSLFGVRWEDFYSFLSTSGYYYLFIYWSIDYCYSYILFFISRVNFYVKYFHFLKHWSIICNFIGKIKTKLFPKLISNNLFTLRHRNRRPQRHNLFTEKYWWRDKKGSFQRSTIEVDHINFLFRTSSFWIRDFSMKQKT